VHATFSILTQHGYLILFFWVLVEQLGVPVPATPLLLAVGALASRGHLHLEWSIAMAFVGALSSDLTWYCIGRQRGSPVLQWLCRISFEPDSCVRKTQGTFEKYGVRALLVAKFVPGLNTVASPLAGIVRMEWGRFVLFDGIGILGWAGAWLMLGSLFAGQIQVIAFWASRLGGWLLVLLLASWGAWLLYKWQDRRRFLRKLSIARIQPEELWARMAAGESMTIVDLRHPLDFEADPELVPGAIRMSPDEVSQRHHEIPRDQEMILYCT